MDINKVISMISINRITQKITLPPSPVKSANSDLATEESINTMQSMYPFVFEFIFGGCFRGMIVTFISFLDVN